MASGADSVAVTIAAEEPHSEGFPDVTTESEAKSWIDEIRSRRQKELESKLLLRSIRVNIRQFSGPETAPFELLQNADDAFGESQSSQTTPSVIFKSTEEYLLVANNGAYFTAEDVHHISYIGEPHKEPGRQSGSMDFGFKSVFQITDFPQIFSGLFRFAFNYDRASDDVAGYLTPIWMDQIPEPVLDLYRSGWTVFYLPFREDLADLPRFCRDDIKFSPLSLAFLRHLRNISLETENGRQSFEVSSVASGRVSVQEQVIGRDPNNVVNKNHNFSIFTKSVPIPEEARTSSEMVDSNRHTISEADVSLAFYLDDDGNIGNGRGSLSYFVPTGITTGLPFDINADFLLNSSRTSIRQDLRWNEVLLSGLAELFIETIKEWRKNARWKYQFYRLIPDPTNCVAPIDRQLATPILEHAQNTEIVVTKSGSLSKPDQVVIAPERIHRVVDLNRWGGRGFLHPRVDTDAAIAVVLRLGAVDYRSKEGDLLLGYFDSFGRVSPPKGFFPKFYDYLNQVVFNEALSDPIPDRPRIQRELRNRAIVLGTTGRHLPSSVTYPPSKSLRIANSLTTQLKFVRESFVSRKYRELFISHLGVSEFTEAEVLRRLLDDPKKTAWSARKKRDAFQFIARQLSRIGMNPAAPIRAKLRTIPIQVDLGWVPAGECYFSSELNQALIPGSPQLDTSRLSDDVLAVYEVLGVRRFPPIKTFPRQLPRVTVSDSGLVSRFGSHSADANLATMPFDRTDWDNYCTWLESQTDMTIERGRIVGDSHDFNEIHYSDWLQKTPGLSAELAVDLLKTLRDNWGEYFSDFDRSRYSWYRRTNRNKRVPSFFMYQLKSKEPWLQTSIGKCVPARYVFLPTSVNRRIVGDLFPFLDCPEQMVKDQASNVFFRNLGLSTHLDKDSILAGLNFISKQHYPSGVSSWLTKTRETALQRTYRELMNTVSEEDRTVNPISILGLDGEFRDPKELYGDSDLDLVDLFKESHPIARVPNIETRLQERFLDFFQVNRISDDLISNAIEGTHDPEKTRYWEERLVSKRDYLYSVVADALLDQMPEYVTDFLSNPIRLKVCSNLHVARTLGETTKVTDDNAYFHRETATLWVDSDEADEGDIADAIAQGFKLHSAIEKFELILTLSNRQLISRFKKWKVQLLPFSSDDEELESSIDSAEATTDESGVMQAEETSSTHFENGADDNPDEMAESTYEWTSSPDPPSGTRGGGGRRSGGTGGKSGPKTVITGKDMIGAPDAETRKKVEKIGMAAAEWIEKNCFGREVEDVSGWESYDLRSWDPADKAGTMRYIEVKASFSGFTPQLTDPEHDVALEKGDQHWLYVVTSDEEDSEYPVFRIQNPANSGSLTLNEHYSPVWRIYGYREATKPIVVPSESLDVQP